MNVFVTIIYPHKSFIIVIPFSVNSVGNNTCLLVIENLHYHIIIFVSITQNKKKLFLLCLYRKILKMF